MKHLQQKQTRFDAHGHWNTVHDIEITMNDALAILECISAQFPAAFTGRGSKWKFGAAILENLPLSLHETVKTLLLIIEAEP